VEIVIEPICPLSNYVVFGHLQGDTSYSESFCVAIMLKYVADVATRVQRSGFRCSRWTVDVRVDFHVRTLVDFNF